MGRIGLDFLNVFVSEEMAAVSQWAYVRDGNETKTAWSSPQELYVYW